MKCCDCCGKYLKNNMEEYSIGIESNNANMKNDILNAELLLCDTCLKSMVEEISASVAVHRRYKNTKIEQSDKME